MKNYDPTLDNTCCTLIQLHMPMSILKDLTLRAEENGHSIELEISMRLSRSLERDLEMIAEDNAFAMRAFDEFQRKQGIEKGKKRK